MVVSKVYGAACLCLIITYVTCQHNVDDYHDDEILFLPGLPYQPTFRQYAGYLHSSPTRRLFYWLVESERSPETDPVVLWLNGGPGCSSLNGFLTENGPFWNPSSDGSELFYNENAWNKIANVIFLESPAGVGFSYATDGKYETGDDQAADDAYRALVYFYRKFSHFRGRELIITGESYAGVYIPTIMDRFLNDTEINLRGAMIGNGMTTGYDHIFSTDMFYWHTHALIDDRTFRELLDKCCGSQGTQEDCNFIPPKSAECATLVMDTVQTIYSLNINRYNIYAPCAVPEVARTLAMQNKWTTLSIELIINQLRGRNLTDPMEKLLRVAAQPAADETEVSFVPCSNSQGTRAYLRREDVQRALHIRSYAETGLPLWNGCSSIVDDQLGTYNSTYSDVLDVLTRLTSHSKKYDMLLYYGDTDFVCSFLTGIRAFHEVAKRASLKDYSPNQPWYYTSLVDGSKQIGGFWERYDNLMYLTFRGSGHMVPTDKPELSLDILDKYISGSLFSM